MILSSVYYCPELDMLLIGPAKIIKGSTLISEFSGDEYKFTIYDPTKLLNIGAFK